MPTTLISHQSLVHPATIKSSVVDVSGFQRYWVECYHAFIEAAANTNQGSFLIQTSREDSGDAGWITRIPFSVFNGTPASVAFGQNEAVGDTVIEVASTTNFTTNGALLYVRDTVLANSEWVTQRTFVTNVSITLLDGLARAHASGTTAFFNNAERAIFELNVVYERRLRVVYLHQGTTGADVAMQVFGEEF